MPDISIDFHQNSTPTETDEGSVCLPDRDNRRASSPESLTKARSMDMMVSADRPRGLWKDEKWIILNKSTFERIFDKTLLQMTADMRNSPLMLAGEGAAARGSSPPRPSGPGPHTAHHNTDTQAHGGARRKTSGIDDPKHKGKRSGEWSGESAGCRRHAGGVTTPTGSSSPLLGRAPRAPGSPAVALGDQDTDHRGSGTAYDMKSGCHDEIIADMPLRDVPCLENQSRASSKSKGGLKENCPKKSPAAIDKLVDKFTSTALATRSEQPDNEQNEGTMIVDRVEQTTAKKGDLRANSAQPPNPGLTHHKENIDGTASNAPNDLGSQCSNNNGHITSSTACGALDFIAGTNKSCTRATCINNGQQIHGKSLPNPDESVGDLVKGESSVEGIPSPTCTRPAVPPHTAGSQQSEAGAARPSRTMSGDYNLTSSPMRTSLDIIASVCSTKEKLTMAIANNGEEKGDGFTDRTTEGGPASTCQSSPGARATGGRKGETGKDTAGSSGKSRDVKSFPTTLSSSYTTKNQTSPRVRNKPTKPRRTKRPKGESKSQQRWVALSKTVVFDMVDLAFGDDKEEKVDNLMSIADRRSSCNLASPGPASDDKYPEEDVDRVQHPRLAQALSVHVPLETRRCFSTGKMCSQTKINNQIARGQTQRKNTSAEMVENDSGEDQISTPTFNANARGCRTREGTGEDKASSPTGITAPEDRGGAPTTRQLLEMIGPNDNSFSPTDLQQSRTHSHAGGGNSVSQVADTVPSVCLVGPVVGRRDDCELRYLLGITAASALTSTYQASKGGLGSDNLSDDNNLKPVRGRNIDCLPTDGKEQSVPGLMRSDNNNLSDCDGGSQALAEGEALDLSTQMARNSPDSAESDINESSSDASNVSGSNMTESLADNSCRLGAVSPGRNRHGGGGGGGGLPVSHTENKLSGKIQLPKSACSNKPLESPKPGWVALSKAEVHTIVDTVMSSMLVDNDTSDLEPNDGMTFDTTGSGGPGDETASPARHSVPCSGRGQTTSDKSGLAPDQSPAPHRRHHPHCSGEALSQLRANDIQDLSSANAKTTSMMTVSSACDNGQFSSEGTSGVHILGRNEDKESDLGDSSDQSGSVNIAKSATRCGGPFKWKSTMLKRVQEAPCDENRVVPAKLPRRDDERPGAEVVKSHSHSHLKPNSRSKRRHHNSNRTGMKSQYKTSVTASNS